MRAVSTAQWAQAKSGLEALERILQRWTQLPDDLVLLREVADAEVDRAARELAEALARHRAGLDPILRRAPPTARIGTAYPRVLRTEHEAFEGSLEELEALVSLVRADGHGGNRQALGQYWRLLWEALARHLRDETALMAMPR